MRARKTSRSLRRPGTDYNAARASAFFLSLMSGRMMLMDHRVIMERAHLAAAMGNREARMFLGALNASSRGRSTVSRGVTLERSSAPRERDPFLRKLLRK
jgi:hypothetical protein